MSYSALESFAGLQAPLLLVCDCGLVCALC